MSTNDRARRGWLMLVVVAAALVACAPDDAELAETESLAGSGADDERSADDAGEQADVDATGVDSSEGPAGADAGGAALAGTSGEVDSKDGQVPVRLDVMRLERNGDLVDLVLVLTNESDVETYEPRTSDWSATSRRVIDGVKLVDQGGQRVYLPVVDSEGDCLCSEGAVELEPGASIEWYATYGGLPADVSEVDVHLPLLSPINGVAVSG